MSKIAGFLLGVLLSATLFVSDARPIEAQAPEPLEPQAPATPPAPISKHPKFSTSVAIVAGAAAEVPSSTTMSTDALASVDPATQSLFDTGLLRLDDAGRLQVYYRVSHIDQAVRDELAALGGVVEREEQERSIIQAGVPPRSLPALADLEYVLSVTAPNYGHVNVGSRLTEGDALLGFAALRATQGVDGSGVTVGVISDGIFGLADAIASGDLPATTLNRVGGKLVSTTGGVIATSFRADGDLEAGLSGPTGAEGTAILEIVHDIAPGAQLRFANFNTSLEFIAAVDFLAANSDVVIDDIGFFQTPYDQTSSISTNTADELNRLTNPIRGYYTSVGNQALEHYQELYVDSGVDGTPFVGIPGNFHHFGPTADTSDSLGLGLRTANSVFLRAGESLVVRLTWDDTFGAASTDYDLFLFQNSPALEVAFSIDNNVFVTGKPTEKLTFTNTTGIDRFYDIFIQNFNDASPTKTFDMFVFGGKAFTGNGSNLNYNTIASSVPAQSDAGGGVVSVGAIKAADPGIDDIESFSSRGPTNNGALKPDVAAIDGVSVTGSGGFASTFFGTSAAAPHVAGLAALLLELRPDLLSGEPGDDPAADRSALRSAIVDTAVDLGAFGPDNTFGSGRVDGVNAATPLLVAPIVNAGPDQIAAEGATVALAPATFTDANPFDTHTAIIDWGDGTAVGAGTVNQASNTVSGTHAYADNGNFMVMVTVTDDDGFAGSDTLAVTVNNVAPVVEAGPDKTVNKDDTVSLAPATFTDAGSEDTHTATIDWGDGTPVGAGTVNQANDTVSGSHAYTDIGNFIVMVTVTDDDGGSGSDSFTFNVILSPAAIPGVTTWGMVALGVAFIALLVWRSRGQHWSRDMDRH